MARQPRSARFWRCMGEVKKIAGEDLSEKELTDLAERLLSRARRIRADRGGMSADEAVSEALKGISEEIITESKLKKRSAYLTVAATAREATYMEQVWGDAPSKGLETIMVGANTARRGAQRSIDADQKGLANQLIAGFEADIERLGAQKHRLYASGQLDEKVYQALDQMYSPQPDFSKIDRDARDFAQIIFKYQESIRVMKNAAGAWIAKLQDYVTHQSHDMFTVRRAASRLDPNHKITGLYRNDEAAHYKAWRDFVVPLLDTTKTFGDFTADQTEKFIHRVWLNIASGEHLKSGASSNGFPSHSTLAGKMSQPRILHFKDAASRYKYDSTFGRGGSLYERIQLQLQYSGHDIALMRRFGPNPQETYNRLKQAARRLTEMSINARDITKWHQTEMMLDAYFDELTGRANTPGDNPLSTAIRSVRLLNTLSKLGSAMLSAISDTAIAASEMRYHGLGLTKSWAVQLDGVFSGRGARGPQRADRMRLASELGVAVDYLRSAVWSRFSAEDAQPGWATRVQHAFFKANGLMWWTDTLRLANAQAIAHNLALSAQRPLAQLDASMQRLFKLFDITGAEWELMRARGVGTIEGKEYLSPRAAERLTDVEIAQLLVSEGVKPTTRRISERRDLVQTKFRDFISARSDYAVIAPGPRSRVYMRGAAMGAAPGSLSSEIYKSLFQFKGFSLAIIEKVWGREVFGYGETGRIRDINKTGMQGLASFIVYSTFLGFVSMYLKAVFNGRYIRPPESPEEGGKLLIQSFLQGGGAGIYGDFLFGQTRDRFGHSAFSALLGPGFASVEDLYSMAKGAPGALIEGGGALFGGDGEAASKWAGKNLMTLISHAPFVNLFYTKMALDYAILYRLQEELSPGSLKRMEKRIREERGQEYFFPPSQQFGQ